MKGIPILLIVSVGVIFGVLLSVQYPGGDLGDSEPIYARRLSYQKTQQNEFNDFDCEDFATQADAQAFFELGSGENDYNNLDNSGNGIACETLPNY